MYDFWYAMGVAVITYTNDPTRLPNLLHDIANAATAPAFDFARRLIIDMPGGVPAFRQTAESTGTLQQAPTDDVRTAIAASVKRFSAAAPPIGIYCAGRFCQMVKIPAFSNNAGSSFADIVRLANTAYTSALAPDTPAALTFPALIGLLMLDSAFAREVPAPTARTLQVLTDFGILTTSPDYRIASRFVTDAAGNYAAATKLLMAESLSPWTRGGVTSEQVFFDPEKTKYAVS